MQSSENDVANYSRSFAVSVSESSTMSKTYETTRAFGSQVGIASSSSKQFTAVRIYESQSIISTDITSDFWGGTIPPEPPDPLPLPGTYGGTLPQHNSTSEPPAETPATSTDAYPPEQLGAFAVLILFVIGIKYSKKRW